MCTVSPGTGGHRVGQHRSEVFPVTACEQIADVAGYRKAVTGPIVIPTQPSGSILFAAVDFRADHLKRIEKRLGWRRYRAPNLCVADRARRFPNGNPIRLYPRSARTRGPGTFNAVPRTLSFKLRVIAFMFKTSVEGLGGRRGMQRIAPLRSLTKNATAESFGADWAMKRACASYHLRSHETHSG